LTRPTLSSKCQALQKGLQAVTMAKLAISALFVDVGGVLATNGWDRQARRRAADAFALDYGEMDERHHLTFDTYEEGKLDLDNYLERLVFYEERSFTRQAFKDFMFAQSQPYPDMLALIGDLKARFGLKVAVLSNEGRELAAYRVSEFQLTSFVDFFIFSSFVHIRKPDEDIYRLALDVAQVPADQVLYFEDRPLFVEVACGLGIHGLQHTGYAHTRAVLAEYGLSLDPATTG
jgi:putative hydrolase of the HAD superfamily